MEADWRKGLRAGGVGKAQTAAAGGTAVRQMGLDVASWRAGERDEREGGGEKGLDEGESEGRR